MIDAVLVALRFAQYMALMLLLGGAAFPFVALRGGDRTIPNPCTWRVMAAIGVAAIVFTLAAMIASVAVMMGMPPWQVDTAVFQAIVTGTGMGWAFLIRVCALVAVLTATVLATSPRFRSTVVAALSATALASLAWSGHAAATPGMAGTFHRLNDAAHLIAASLWFGAIIGFLLLTRAVHSCPKPKNAVPLLDAVHGFAPVGILLVGVVSLTGLLNAELIFGIAKMPNVLLTGYGGLVAAKVGLVGVMLLCAARNSLVSRGYSAVNGRPNQDSTAALHVLRSSLAIEAFTAVAVVVVVAILGMLSPVQ